MANRRTLEEQIDQARLELKQKEAKIKDLMQRQRSRADKARTHRLCKRGGLIESLLPGLIKLPDEQFEAWVEKVIMSSYSMKLISELAPPPPDDDGAGTSPAQEREIVEHVDTDAPEQPAVQLAAEPAQTPSNERANGNQQHSDGPSQNGNYHEHRPGYQHGNNRHHGAGNASYNAKRNH